MEGGNDNEHDNNTLPSFAHAELETTGPSEATKASSSSSQSRSTSVPSDLVAGTKLLTREEECTLKTALAFVVLKARAKARVAAALEASDTATFKNHRIAGNGSAAHSHHGREASVLDHLFCHPGNSNGGNHPQNPPRSLECTTRGRKHIDYMFRAAKTLAETWVVRNRNINRNHQELQPVPPTTARNASTITSKALVGATGHLAHQLQLLLVANQNLLGHSSNHQSGVVTPSSATPSSLATATPNNKKQQAAAVPHRRYRKPFVSSKSTADSSTSTSTPTPSSSSRKGGEPVVVTPATIGRKISNNNSSTSSSHGDETSQNEPSAMGAVFFVQGWIRSTLLQQQREDQREQTAANAERTILSCQTTTVLDVLASFHVYTVMIPQIAQISPPLIGHIFQVVARLVRDLYDDRISVIGENTVPPSGGGGEHGEGDLPTMGRNENSNARQLLNHLATSALELLELCWTTEIGVGHSRSKESHRSFLLLSLQGILGHLLVPLPRSELAGEHYRLAVSASQYLAFQQRRHYQQQLVRQKTKLPTSVPRSLDSKRQKQSRHQSEASPRSNTAREYSRNENTGSIQFQGSRAPPRPSRKPNAYVGGCLLDPEAKLFLRMAVYRLILMGNKG